MAELLKCLQQLHNSLYPAMVGRSASVQQASQACAHTSLQDEQPPAHTTTSSSMPCRWVEVAAALLLYFVCVPQRPVSHEIVKLLRAAAMPTACQRQRQRQQQSGQRVLLLEQPTYQLAVRATVAAMHGHWCRFLAVLHTGELPPLVKAVMRQHVWRMQLLAVQRAVRGSCFVVEVLLLLLLRACTCVADQLTLHALLCLHRRRLSPTACCRLKRCSAGCGRHRQPAVTTLTTLQRTSTLRGCCSAQRRKEAALGRLRRWRSAWMKAACCQ
jgi:hypothetical protein